MEITYIRLPDYDLPWEYCCEDADNDGHPELTIGTDYGRVYVYEAAADATFRLQAALTPVSDGPVRDVVLADDMDRDGRSEIAAVAGQANPAFIHVYEFVGDSYELVWEATGSSHVCVGELRRFTFASDTRPGHGEHLQTQVLFIPESVRSPLDDSDLVVQPLDESQRDLALQPTPCGNPVPAPEHQLRKLLVGLQPLLA